MEVHYGNGPVDGVGGTIKNQVFQEVKSGRLTVSTPKEFSDAVQKLLFLLLLWSIYIYYIYILYIYYMRVCVFIKIIAQFTAQFFFQNS